MRGKEITVFFIFLCLVVRGVFRTQLLTKLCELQIEFVQTQHHVLGRLIQDHTQLLVLVLGSQFGRVATVYGKLVC